MATGQSEITLRFLAAPTDVATLGGSIHGGRVLEWIDKSAYALAVGWSGGYCVTAYVGDIRFARPIESGQLVEVTSRLMRTGRSSMDVHVTVSSADPQDGVYTEATTCVVVFVAVDSDGRPTAVPPWTPVTDLDRQLLADAQARVTVRRNIEQAMAEQTYTDASTAPAMTLRFLAAPADVNWGGKAHGGTVMRWIDEAAYVCAAGWSGKTCVAAYSGGIRFYRPIMIGHIVEVQARLLHTGRSSMHVSLHVRSGDPKAPDLQLTTHCLTIFVALDEHGEPTPVRSWEPELEEDRRLDVHAQHLIQLRARLAPVHPS